GRAPILTVLAVSKVRPLRVIGWLPSRNPAAWARGATRRPEGYAPWRGCCQSAKRDGWVGLSGEKRLSGAGVGFGGFSPPRAQRSRRGRPRRRIPLCLSLRLCGESGIAKGEDRHRGLLARLPAPRRKGAAGRHGHPRAYGRRLELGTLEIMPVGDP